jgi:tRNA threonylcarbamoyladenosine biosynthesis protein TsaB
VKLLAFDTSTERMSVAVQRSDPGAPDQVWQHEALGGAQTSTHLIPVIQQLMARAGLQFTELDAIVFGRGPGSFTGLRTACSVAQGLAFAAQRKVLPVDTLLAVAEEARLAQAAELASWRVTALLDARMDELYGASYFFDQRCWSQTTAHALLRPEELVVDEATALAGNVFAAYGARLPCILTQRIAAMPTATALLRLAPALLAQGAAVNADQALPLYVRDKVAKTTLERAVEKSAS